MPACPELMQEACLAVSAPAATDSGSKARSTEWVGPNALVRSTFCLSLFAIPFTQIYLPGTGERIGVTRLIHVLILCGILSQPRVCLRLVPTALFWFLGYLVLRIVWGLWLTPELSDMWWPKSRRIIEVLPWVWVMFNVLQFPTTRRDGLWALGLGGALCALLHVVGIGVETVDDALGNRSSVLGLNANDIGLVYATAGTALFGLWVCETRGKLQQWAPFPLISIIAIAMAKTGSRSAILVFALGVAVLLLVAPSNSFKVKRMGSVVLLGAVILFILWQIPTVLQRFDELSSHNLGRNNPRARMAPVLLEMFLRSPIHGLGPDSYEFELTRRAMPYLIAQQHTIVAHNLALLLLVETGVVGFLVLSIGIGKALAAAWRARRNPGGPMGFALLLPLVIAAATVAQPMYLPVFWAAIAFALAGRG